MKIKAFSSFLFLIIFLFPVTRTHDHSVTVFNKSPLLFLSKADCETFRPQHSLIDDESLQQSISTQTHVSTTLATQLLSNKFRNSNVVFSPLSIHVVLSLLAVGSGGQTRNQLLTFLETNTTDELNSLYSQLVPFILEGGSPSGGPQLSFANAVWIQKTLSPKSSFKQVLDNIYKAGCNQFDLVTKKAVEVANEVNLWVEKQTSGRITEVLPDNAVNNFTQLIFANAVSFKGTWSQKFDQSLTKDSDFHLLDGSKVEVPFMTSMKKQFLHEYDDFKVLGLPYLQGQDKRKFTMYFFLPNTKDGLESLLEKIGSKSDFFDSHIPLRKKDVGEFLIPKFKISSGFETSDLLTKLGLTLPFSNVNDFTEMVDSSIGESLYVSSIHHKSFVEVNEEGTEAKAASALSAALSMKVMVDFVADHPFLFVIREDVTGVILFMGQVTDPRVG